MTVDEINFYSWKHCLTFGFGLFILGLLKDLIGILLLVGGGILAFWGLYLLYIEKKEEE